MWNIRYCLSCNTCWEAIIMHVPIACVNNSRVSRSDEVDYYPPRAGKPRRVVVVGAGIAGMEAAWAAEARGARCDGFRGVRRDRRQGLVARETTRRRDGAFHLRLSDCVRAAAGARFVLGRKVTAGKITSAKPDAVIRATGSSMIPLDWLPPVHRESWVVDLRQAVLEVLRHDDRQPGTAVLFDADHTEGTYATDVQLATRQDILRRMADQRIQIIPLSEPRWSDSCAEERTEIVNVYSGDVWVIKDLRPVGRG
jgi:hypothetical protein